MLVEDSVQFGVNNPAVIPVPFANPEAELDLLIGDRYYDGYKEWHTTTAKFMARSIRHQLPNSARQNWTYVFQTKDQIGSFFYFPSLNFQNAGGGFGPILESIIMQSSLYPLRILKLSSIFSSVIGTVTDTRWNLTAGAARPNPQGTFNVANVM
ncbi:hypothetical protein HS088_TW09G00642 [Tripterygium wilfordii]|uniref:Plastocyanin-like domain-containing protein n=1 Tax=Tripterygium wilfordii TaxID=458696 RepID=A0A7J7D8F2_TRIWF|nr:uncharacterized protein LOC120005307 [Tripterygium wilfordii]XP_038710804.1 uncharacterized protein LOC120005307 [Tripterygium wilfordii]XP_038710805.1 uncharacterized protein LOC120005307 [Tripterygium wilfordii]XP_038710806.1 uncharacterized protein LOC120005307 [Tripterygium wilfordii]KAF5742591.1 hypothetical protein HS088_TW09G00642 [Tripterygium wilfordii]